MTEKRKRKAKSKFRIYAEFIPFWLVVAFFRLFSLKTAYAIAKFFFKFVYIFHPKSRNRTIQHLLHAGIARNLEEAKTMARKTYENFAKLLVEIAKSKQLFHANNVFEVTATMGNAESCEMAYGKNKRSPVIMLTAHYGNWELAGPSCALKSGVPLVSVMRPFANPLIGRYIVGHREGYNHSCCDKSGGIKAMLKAIKSGCNIAILADQHANSKEGVETVFFGHPARSHTSPALLHLKTGAPILPLVMRRLDDDFHFAHVYGEKIEYTPTGDKEKDVRTVTQMYTTALEKLIRECPLQWLWSHRRWLDINRREKK